MRLLLGVPSVCAVVDSGLRGRDMAPDLGAHLPPALAVFAELVEPWFTCLLNDTSL